ncbi:FAD-dependent oxidoreductase [Streptomyces lydicus]|uniref:FAD-dependent oxidoreductase n=1 Tax=Streptomyces lydicus TaxID=47763 RepID=A0A3S9YJY7_9ACTN|nr:FAD-dependent oxidoreductase [Streptomyces lydicus]AZS75322.1 FAD-dependent oxidoreductase [Streptomyces lydicus]
MTARPIAVVGASAAGLAAAEALRRGGWRGPLTLIGDEPHLPYDRPPLSKQLLHGAWEPDRLLLRTEEQLAPLGLDLRLGTRATGLDVATRTLTLDGGERLGCAGVIIATGVTARTLPGADRIAGVHTLRTLDEALALRSRLANGGTPGSGGVAAGGGGSSRLPADLVLLAIGSRPAVEWLADPALDTTDGLRCDEYCAAAPGIYAAGDVARWDHPVHGRPLRFEHRMNATEQGMAAARNLLAELSTTDPAVGTAQDAPAPERRPFAPVPYFWSDQYDLKLQAYGLTAGADRVEATVLDRAERRVLALYGRDGHAVGVLAAGLPPRRIRALRAVIATPLPWEEARERIGAATAAG